MKKAPGGRPKSEAELLSMISPLLPNPSPDVMTGIGDDCAVIRPPHGRDFLLLKTDALVEGVHFSPGTPLGRVGWKALCRPLSDIASMGGTPGHALITVAAPRSWTSAHWKALYRGIGRAAARFGVSVVGGETVRSPGPVFLSVSLSGSVPPSRLKRRDGARPGDLICVTGRLGGSLASGRHLGFTPRLAEGAWLGGRQAVTAMMDLSDGLGSDLPKLASESQASFRITPPLLPRHRGCSAEQAVSDGEDYELLLTVKPSGWRALETAWGKSFPRLPLTPIGEILPGDTPPTPLVPGHDHLAQEKQTR